MHRDCVRWRSLVHQIMQICATIDDPNRLTRILAYAEDMKRMHENEQPEIEQPLVKNAENDWIKTTRGHVRVLRERNNCGGVTLRVTAWPQK